MGEILGMEYSDVQINDFDEKEYFIDDWDDWYTKEEIITSINVKGRDNARRPIAWNASENGGFTTGTPWIALNENYKEINVEAALNDSNSIFYTYQELVQLRKENPIMVWGDFELVDTVDNVFSYYREYKGERWLVVTNFSNEEQPFSSENEIEKVIIQNDNEEITNLKEISLRPWQAFVVKVK